MSFVPWKRHFCGVEKPSNEIERGTADSKIKKLSTLLKNRIKLSWHFHIVLPIIFSGNEHDFYFVNQLLKSLEYNVTFQPKFHKHHLRLDAMLMDILILFQFFLYNFCVYFHEDFKDLLQWRHRYQGKFSSDSIL